MLGITTQQLEKTGCFCSVLLLLTRIRCLPCWSVSAVPSLLYKAVVLPVTDRHTGAVCLHCCVLLAHEALWDPLGRKTPYKGELLLVQSFLAVAKSQTFSQEIHQHTANRASLGLNIPLSVCSTELEMRDICKHSRTSPPPLPTASASVYYFCCPLCSPVLSANLVHSSALRKLPLQTSSSILNRGAEDFR